jgi:hypothetical protein
MTTPMSLNSIRADVRRDDLLREARHARLTAGASQGPSLFQRALARLHADAGRSSSPRRTYELAPTDR